MIYYRKNGDIEWDNFSWSIVIEVIVMVVVLVLVSLIVFNKPKDNSTGNTIYACPDCLEDLVLECYRCGDIFDQETGERIYRGII